MAFLYLRIAKIKDMTNITPSAEKQCSNCGVAKPITEFYKDKSLKSGYRSDCIQCKLAYCTQWQKDHPKPKKGRKIFRRTIEQEREVGRLKWKAIKSDPLALETIRKTRRESMVKYRLKYPEKKAASACITAIPKPKGHHLHHWSYNEEHYKDCIILKAWDHSKAHRYLTYDPVSFMFFIKGTKELLDSKEKHLKYITEMIQNMPD